MPAVPGNDSRRRNRRHIVGGFESLAADERHADADAGGLDMMASLRWCQASVFTAELSPALPSRETNRNKPSFTTTTTTSTDQSLNGLGDRCGCMISPNAVRTIHSAAPSNIAATMPEAIGSALPWP